MYGIFVPNFELNYLWKMRGYQRDKLLQGFVHCSPDVLYTVYNIYLALSNSVNYILWEILLSTTGYLIEEDVNTCESHVTCCLCCFSMCQAIFACAHVLFAYSHGYTGNFLLAMLMWFVWKLLRCWHGVVATLCDKVCDFFTKIQLIEFLAICFLWFFQLSHHLAWLHMRFSSHAGDATV